MAILEFWSKISIIFYQDMSQFDCEIEYVGSSCALILDEVFPEDEGNYMVVASNIHGVVQSCARLNVAS